MICKINFSQRILCCFCKARFRIPPGETGKSATILNLNDQLGECDEKIIWTVASAFILSGAANALGNRRSLKVTDIQNHQPSTVLYVGNSYSFYTIAACMVTSEVFAKRKQDSLESPSANNFFWETLFP